jgi:hypothetical protein
VFFGGHNSSRLSFFVGLLLFDELFGRKVVNLFSSLYNNSFVPLVDSCAFGHQKCLACLGSFPIGEPPKYIIWKCILSCVYLCLLILPPLVLSSLVFPPIFIEASPQIIYLMSKLRRYHGN